MTPSQVSQMTVVYQAKCNRTDTPNKLGMRVQKADGTWESEPTCSPGNDGYQLVLEYNERFQPHDQRRAWWV